MKDEFVQRRINKQKSWRGIACLQVSVRALIYYHVAISIQILCVSFAELLLYKIFLPIQLGVLPGARCSDK